MQAEGRDPRRIAGRRELWSTGGTNNRLPAQPSSPKTLKNAGPPTRISGGMLRTEDVEGHCAQYSRVSSHSLHAVAYSRGEKPPTFLKP